MAKEIERKYLVANDAWRANAQEGDALRQGYLAAEKSHSVRVRLRAGKGTLTIKSGQTVEAGEAGVRDEYEYVIPADEASAMLDRLCHRPLIEKTRYLVEHGGHTWEIDVFAGENVGLVVAEVELTSADEAVELPSWVGEDVTDDPRYLNANLAQTPYSAW
ncbi:MAG: CYTH domain-containing protein [Acidobacteriota bacterium]